MSPWSFLAVMVLLLSGLAGLRNDRRVLGEGGEQLSDGGGGRVLGRGPGPPRTIPVRTATQRGATTRRVPTSQTRSGSGWRSKS